MMRDIRSDTKFHYLIAAANPALHKILLEEVNAGFAALKIA